MSDMLAPTDVKWYEIQEKVFTRWVNDYLEDVDQSIESLKTDFQTGVKLILLLEAISAKEFQRYNKKPRMKFHKMENITMAIEFIKSEGIRLVNIGTDDIYEGNMRIILGLVWTLILRYEIKCGAGNDTGTNALLEWIRSKIPEYDIKNFTKHWNDGRAVCALTNAMLPGLVSNHRELDPTNKEANATRGIDLAWDRLKVDKLILPDEMTHPKVDKLAMMTYLAQFRNIKPEDMITDASLCKAYGPGLEKCIVKDMATFTVEVPTQVTSELVIRIASEQETCEVKQSNDKEGVYECTYTPMTPGVHRVDVLVGGLHIPHSTFNVPVLEKEAARCRAFGEGLSKGMRGDEAVFNVEVPPDIDREGMLTVTVTGPGDSSTAVTMTKSDNYTCAYTPTGAGEHTIAIEWGKQPIPGSLFAPLVEERPAALCKAYGEGLSEGVVGDVARFTVEMPATHSAEQLAITCSGAGSDVAVSRTADAAGGGLVQASYTPSQEGEHTIQISYGDEDIPGSCFKAAVEQRSIASRSRAHGPGLEGGTCDMESAFKVDTPVSEEEVEGKLEIKVVGPADEAEATVTKREGGVFDVVYMPTTPGDYEVHVTIEGENVPGSVFRLSVLQKSDAKRCRAFGPGLTEGLRDFVSEFWVEGPGDLDMANKLIVDVTGPEEEKVEVKVEKEGDGKMRVSYTPLDEGEHKVTVQVSGEDVKGSVFVVPVAGPRGVVQVYFSTTTSSVIMRSNIDRLEQLFFIKKVHLRPDFQPWVAMDMIEKSERDEIYAQAAVRKLPLVWIDDDFVGSWDEIEELNECGELDPLLAMHTVHLMTPEEHMKRLMGLGEESSESAAARTHFCGDCGFTKLTDNSYCPECGATNPLPFTSDNIGKRLRMQKVEKPPEVKRNNGKAAAIQARMNELVKRKEERQAEEEKLLSVPLDPATINHDEFFVNCYIGNHVEAERMLKAGMDPNLTDDNGNSPWRAAMENQQDHMAALLVRYGAHFLSEDLFIAVCNDEFELVKAMVEKGMPVNILDEEGSTPFTVAIEEQHGKIARYLRKKGAKLPTAPGFVADANPDKAVPAKPLLPEPSGPVPDEEDFFIACAEGDLAQVLNMVACRANVNAQDEDGTSVLSIAIGEGHLEVAALLKKFGAL